MGGAYSAGFIDLVDCDIRVDTYDVVKVVYDKVNLVICVDDSGSMSGRSSISTGVAMPSL